jgi:hypothetical protein
MKVPRTILIDTNIFDKNRYRFSSRWVERFVRLASANKSTLLLPDPIEREVIRHIKEGSRAAQSAIQKACDEAPLIYRWPKWFGAKAVEAAASEIEAATMAGWATFLEKFTVEKLSYQDVNLTQIMDWYDQQQPPFGVGDKRKEFPDAFTIAAALGYSKRHDLPIAVVSADDDIKKACALYEQLVYYPDLPAIAEALVIETSKTTPPSPANIKAAILVHQAKIIACITEDFPDLSFYHVEDLEADVEDIVIKAVNISSIRVISIEKDNCTIALDAEVEFSAYVEYGDPDTMIHDSSEDFHMPLFTRAGTITESVSISATANLQLSDDWNEILLVDDLEFENSNIAVEARPPIRHDDDHEEQSLEADFPPHES